jgi:DNA-binding transcriptional MerR regulator
MALHQLDNDDFPTYSVGQAAQLLEVQPAFLRSLDTAGVIHPERSTGHHRRYTRRQLALAARVRELFDQGHTLTSAAQVLTLEHDLQQARDERDHAHKQRDQAREQRDQAYEQRDQAREQRDQAYEQRDQAYQQRDEAREQRDPGQLTDHAHPRSR